MHTPDNGTMKSSGTWHHVAVIGARTTVAAIYVDGSAVTLSSFPGNITNTTIAGLNIGRRNNNGRYFSGSLDEIRLSNAQRSADWIKTEYNNQNSPSTFYSISPPSSGGNQSPAANPGGPYSGTVGTAVPFNGSGSYDPDGTISNYAWNFGDGGTGSGATPTHTYSSAGTYTATLTVTDNAGATGSANATVIISAGGSGSLNG